MKLIILDRDGVINQDSDTFIKSPQEWEPIENSIKAIAKLHAASYTIAIATNQSGIARGLFDLDTLESIHKKMLSAIEKEGAKIEMIAYCPHGPDDLCKCRKPLPGLFTQISQQLDCPLKNIPAIGDSLRDLQAASSVGAQPILVRTGKGERTLRAEGLPDGTKVFDNLFEAANSLIQ